MWEKILEVLLHELETNPDRVFSILEKIIDLIKGNPDAQKAVIDIARARLMPTVK